MKRKERGKEGRKGEGEREKERKERDEGGQEERKNERLVGWVDEWING